VAVRAALLAARAQGRGASAGEEPPRCEIQASLPQNLNAGEGCGRQPWLRTVTPLDGEGIEGESGGSRYFQLHTRRSETRIDLEQFGGRAAGSGGVWQRSAQFLQSGALPNTALYDTPRKRTSMLTR